MELPVRAADDFGDDWGDMRSEIRGGGISSGLDRDDRFDWVSGRFKIWVPLLTQMDLIFFFLVVVPWVVSSYRVVCKCPLDVYAVPGVPSAHEDGQLTFIESLVDLDGN